MYDSPSQMKYHQPICLCDCSMPKVCAACVIGNAPDQPIAQNSVALAHLHFGVRNLGMEHSVAADVTMTVILTHLLASFHARTRYQDLTPSEYMIQ
jgi:hypothetical protein